jgi:hypothetical protein
MISAMPRPIAPFLLLLLLLAVAPFASAQEQAFTNRPTELKERASAEARTLATLPADTALRVVARGGGWTRVEADGKSGWVRVWHLRFPVTAARSSGSSGGGFLSGLSSMLGGGKPTGTRATIATTGIRGLSPEDLRNASPDPQALRRLQSYRADRGSAERFAREGKLSETRIEYEGAPQ